MSLIKAESDLNIGCDVHNKSSFSERICDDLSEFILQYLPLKDKLKLECVSKQFQRTIFQRVYDLNLDYFIMSCLPYGNLSLFESVIKKCPQINSLVLRNFVNFPEEMLDLIIKYCNNLFKIDTNCSLLCQKLSKILSTKSFALKTSKSEKTVFDLLSHIQELEIYSNNRYIYHRINYFDGLKNLKRVSLCLLSEQEIQDLETFLQNNKKLKYLEIDFTSIKLESNQYNKGVNTLLNQLSKVKQLIHLKIFTKIGLNEKQFQKGVNQIGVNCRNLKSFGLTLHIVSNNCSKINEFFSPFKSLKRLNIELIEENTCNVFSFELFKGMEYITDLCLKFSAYNYRSVIDCDIILKNIDKYLPRLQYLQIANSIEDKESLANIFSGLPKLHTIKLNLMSSKRIVSTIVSPIRRKVMPYPHNDKIVDKCKNVRLVKLNYRDDLPFNNL